jgi:hypothetical protein
VLGCAADLERGTLSFSLNGSFEHPMGVAFRCVLPVTVASPSPFLCAVFLVVAAAISHYTDRDCARLVRCFSDIHVAAGLIPAVTIQGGGGGEIFVNLGEGGHRFAPPDAEYLPISAWVDANRSLVGVRDRAALASAVVPPIMLRRGISTVNAEDIAAAAVVPVANPVAPPVSTVQSRQLRFGQALDDALDSYLS